MRLEYDIKTLIFDLGGVYFTRGSYLAIEKLADIYNIENIELVREIFGDRYKKEGHLLRLGLISMNEFEQRFISQFKINEEDLRHIRNIWFGSYVVHYKMEELVRELKRNYRLVIFSGNIKERVDFLNKRYDFLKYFDDLIFSYDYQKNKNDVDFYRELIKHIECIPSQAILIDDERKNLIIARSLGIHGIQFYYTEYIINQLKLYNIKFNI